MASGTDGYRTAAVDIGYGDFSIRLNMFAGMNKTGDIIDKGSSQYPNGVYKGGDVDKYRLGALSLGYKHYRIGANSENIRNLFQNLIVHKITGDPYFKNLNNKWNLYFNFGSTNRYGLW